MDRVILAAGGLETDPQRERFAAYYSNLLHKISSKSKPVICQLAQSQGEKAEKIERDRVLYSAHGCEFISLTTFKTYECFTETIARADGFFVIGGNTINMLAIWSARGLVPLLHAAYAQGKPIAGYSAGAMCWFKQYLTSDKSLPAGHSLMPGLGWLEGSFTPHYADKISPEGEATIYEDAIAAGALVDGYGCDDGVFGIFKNEQLQGFSSVEPEGRAYKISRQGKNVVRDVIIPMLI